MTYVKINSVEDAIRINNNLSGFREVDFENKEEDYWLVYEYGEGKWSYVTNSHPNKSDIVLSVDEYLNKTIENYEIF